MQALEDSDSEHSAVDVAQHDARLAGSDDFEQQVASQAPDRAPVDELEPAVEILSGVGSPSKLACNTRFVCVTGRHSGAANTPH